MSVDRAPYTGLPGQPRVATAIATINRDGIGGYWSEHDLGFDASLLQAGTNVMQLTVPAGPLTGGIIYDYLRLELDENARVTKRSDAPPPVAGP